MDWDNVRKEQIKEAMALAERGNEPDNIMMLTPEEYAMSMPRGMESTGESSYDLMKSPIEDFPITLIGNKEILEPFDMSVYNFSRAINHPIKRYLEASLMALNNAMTEEISDEQLANQASIYVILLEIAQGALRYYEEELEQDKAYCNAPNINYIEKKERENDSRDCMIVVGNIQSMVKTAQEGIDLVSRMLADTKGTRS